MRMTTFQARCITAAVAHDLNHTWSKKDIARAAATMLYDHEKRIGAEEQKGRLDEEAATSVGRTFLGFRSGGTAPVRRTRDRTTWDDGTEDTVVADNVTTLRFVFSRAGGYHQHAENQILGELHNAILGHPRDARVELIVRVHPPKPEEPHRACCHGSDRVCFRCSGCI